VQLQPGRWRGLKACGFLISHPATLFQVACPFVEPISHVDKHRAQRRVRVESGDLAQVRGALPEKKNWLA
jgi:hypothetical protein